MAYTPKDFGFISDGDDGYVFNGVYIEDVLDFGEYVIYGDGQILSGVVKKNATITEWSYAFEKLNSPETWQLLRAAVRTCKISHLL